MSIPPPTGALLAEYAGEVRCERSGAQLHFSGSERGRGLPLRVVFAGGVAGDLPQRLQDVRIRSHASGWQLLAGSASYPVTARSVQLLRDVSLPAALALPGARAGWRGRAAWALLLNVLRIPGAAGILKRSRGG